MSEIFSPNLFLLMTQTYEKWEVKKTCDSENTISGRDTRPARSCSMYSNTRYMLFERREVIMPSNFMIFGWSSLRRIVISLAMNLMLSGWKLSKRTFFKANIFPVSTSRARNTLLYVPCPIYRNENIEKTCHWSKVAWYSKFSLVKKKMQLLIIIEIVSCSFCSSNYGLGLP